MDDGMNCPQCGSPIKEGTRFCTSYGTLSNVASLSVEDEARIAILERALGSKYRIVSKVGSGGFAEVYLGEHTQLGRQVAIKILHGGFSMEEDVVERFRRESKSVARLSHPNIIDIYDVGESSGTYFFVMKYVEGESLRQRMMKQGRLTPAESVPIIKQVADALSYAHDNSVIHRDIKPANVMLDRFGKPVLMDFGIARVQFESNLTRKGALMGTPLYLAPEMPLGHTIDGRSDIYSLGIMFYEMLAGRPPFDTENPVTLIFKHIHEQPPALQDLVPELNPEVCAVVHKMMAKDPDERYQSAQDVVFALEELEIAGIIPPPLERTRDGVTPRTLQLKAGEASRTILEPRPVRTIPPASTAPAVPAPAAPAPAPPPPMVAAQEPAVPVRAKRGLSMGTILAIVGGVAFIGIALLIFLMISSTDKDSGERADQRNEQKPDPQKIPDPVKDPDPTPTALVSVSIDSQPWAFVDITSRESNQLYTSATPCVLQLPAGQYTVNFRSPNSRFAPFARTIDVSDSNRRFRFKFDSLNPDEIAEALLQQ